MVVLLFHNHSIKSPVYPKKHIHQGFLYPYLSFNVNPPYSSGIPINIYIYINALSSAELFEKAMKRERYIYI